MAALMLGVGAYVVSEGAPAGPGQSAIWPAATEISVNRPLGRQPDGADPYEVGCTVMPGSGQPMRMSVSWGQPMNPNFAGPATITCDEPVRILTGARRTIAAVTRGTLVILPLFVACLGILFFFPHFTRVWASLSPYRNAFRRRDRI